MKLPAPLKLALLSLFLALPVLAQEAAAAPDAGVLDNPMPVAQAVYKAVALGDWWTAAAGVLVLLVALIRWGGPKVHELIPDFKPIDLPLDFLFHTKPGGYVLNLMTSAAVVMTPAVLSGTHVTWALVKPVLMVSGGAALLWEMLKDSWDWWQAKKAPAAPIAPAPQPPPAA